MMMPRMQQSLRWRSSNLAACVEWQSKVQRLWSFRRQHWEGFRNGKFNAPPNSPSASASPPPPPSTSRSAPEWIPPHAKPLFHSPPRPTCSLAGFARKSTTPFYKPSAWKQEIVPVPLGLATQTQSQLLVGLVSRGSEMFLEKLQRPHKGGYSNFEVLKPSPRRSGFGSSRLPSASQAAMEDSLKKEHLKHRASIYAANVAFGRSNYASCLTQNNDKNRRKSAGQVKYTMKRIIRCEEGSQQYNPSVSLQWRGSCTIDEARRECAK